MVREVGLRDLAGCSSRCRWQPASVQVVELSSSITCRTHTRTHRHATSQRTSPKTASSLQGARTPRVGGRWICGSVSDADAGDTTRGRGPKGRWVWLYLMQPTFRRRQELVAVSAPTGNARRNRRLVRAGVQEPKVTVLRVVSGQTGRLWARSASGPAVLMMKLMGRAPLANERQQPRRVQKAIAFLQLEPRRRGSLSTTIVRRRRPFLRLSPLSSFFTSAASGGSSGAVEALFAGLTQPGGYGSKAIWWLRFLRAALRKQARGILFRCSLGRKTPKKS